MQTFEVQNVTASQRTDGSHIADVCYDLSPDDLFVSFRITSELSIDGGETWMGLNIPTQANIMGDNVLPGDNKCFSWIMKTNRCTIFTTRMAIST